MIRILKQQIPLNYNTLYHLALFLLMGSIPLSKYTTSMSQMGLAALWLWHGVNTAYLKNLSPKDLLNPVNLIKFLGKSLMEIWLAFVRKLKTFFSNKPAVVIASMYVMLIAGLLWTTDMHYALKDLRTKLPLLILPLFLSTGPEVNTRTLNWMLTGFGLALLGGTIYRLVLLLNLPVADSRNISAHVSHIRFSLNLVLGMFSLLYIARKRFFSSARINLLLVLLASWFMAFMVYMQYDTGVVITIIVTIFIAFISAFRQSGLRSRIILIVASLIILLVPVIYVLSVIHEFRTVKPVYFLQLDQYTQNGNRYTHDTTNFVVENGKYPGLYICDKELRSGWNRRSSIPFDSLDHKKQLLRSTLIRYMASKDLRKDSVGLCALDSKDIGVIESGIANSKSTSGFNIKTQIYNYLIAYRNYRLLGDPNAGTLVQRLEYWRTSLLIFSKHPIIGVGTGDLPAAFDKQYDEMKSPLKPEYRKRSHNQYLSTLVAFGILGFIWFIFSLVYPPVKLRGFRHYYFVVFYLVAMISMVSEDTIESQEGVTFFVFFTCLFLLAWSDVKQKAEKMIETQEPESTLSA